MANIYLARHGQASFGSENYDQLSELGLRQCFLLGQWMKQTRQPIDQLKLGDMHRQRQSAEAFMEGYGARLPQSVDVGLNEFDHIQVLRVSYPEFSSAAQLTHFLSKQEQPRAVFEKLFDQALLRWMSGAHDADYAESWLGFQERVHGSMDRLASDDIDSIVFSSAGPITVACQKLLSIPDSHLLHLLSTMLNSSVTRLLKKHGRLKLVGINSVAHLEQHADPSLISYR